MNANIGQLTKLFIDELKLCNVQPNESIVVVSQPDSRPGYKEAFLAAIESLGAHAISLEFPGFRNAPLPYRGRALLDVDRYINQYPFATETLRKADMVIDITAEGLVHTKARAITLENGARMLMVWEPQAILERMFPRQSLRERVEKAQEMIVAAETMRVVSEAGTDITVRIGKEEPSITQYGYTDEPGRWDHFAGGFVAFYPIDDSPNGRIVLDVGDILLPLNRYIENRVYIEIKDGYITEITGDGLDAMLFKHYFEIWNDREVYATSHFGFGLDETALWEALQFYGKDTYGMDARAFMGNFMWSTGPNAFVGRHTPCHYDIPMRNCTIYLDNQIVVEEGTIIEPSLKPESNGCHE